MKAKKFIICLFIFSIMLMFCNCSQTKAQSYSGTCGQGVSWELDEDYTLTISGKGQLKGTPWTEVAKKVSIDNNKKIQYYKIDKVIIKDGVVSTGFNTFSYMTVKSIEIPGSFDTINSGFAQYDPYLETVTIGEGVTNLFHYAFEKDPSLKNITIPETITEIDKHTFTFCDSLKTITFPKSIKMFSGCPFGYCPNIEKVINKSTASCPLGCSACGYTWKVNGNSVKSVSSNTAITTKNKYKISSYTLNGGKLSTKKVSSYTYGTSFKLPTAKKSGYVFAGWKSPDVSIYPVKTLPTTTIGNLKLKAVWEKISISNVKTKTIQITVKPNKYSIVKKAGLYTYVVEYATNKDFSDKKVVRIPNTTNGKIKGDTTNVSAKYTSSKTTVKISKLTKGKKYYVRIKYLDLDDYDPDVYPDDLKDDFYAGNAFYSKTITVKK